jgi:hypothetical protein
VNSAGSNKLKSIVVLFSLYFVLYLLLFVNSIITGSILRFEVARVDFHNRRCSSLSIYKIKCHLISKKSVNAPGKICYFLMVLS